MFYINFLFITQSLIEVTVLYAMLFKNFDKFSSVLHFSTLKLLLFSCRKSLRFFSAHILKRCVFSKKCAWKTQNADQKLSLVMCYMSDFSNLVLENLLSPFSIFCTEHCASVCVHSLQMYSSWFMAIADVNIWW